MMLLRSGVGIYSCTHVVSIHTLPTFPGGGGGAGVLKYENSIYVPRRV